VSPGLIFRHGLQASSFRIPAKAGTGMFVELGRGVTMYFARGFLRRIRSQPETVRLQFKAIRQRLWKAPDRKTGQVLPNAAATAANHIFTVILIEVLNIP